MGGNGAKTSDFYQVLGLNKECTETELKHAYKKLALELYTTLDVKMASRVRNGILIVARRPETPNTWKSLRRSFRPYKKPILGSQFADQIPLFSFLPFLVLSNVDKRFLYDVGVYDSDDDENGMADFMSEMAVMMSQNKPNGNRESFEELKDLFDEMFQSDMESYESTSQTGSSNCYSSSLFSSCGESSSSTSSNKRGSSAMSNTKIEDPLCFDDHFQGFSLGAGGRREERGGGGGGGSRRKGRRA